MVTRSSDLQEKLKEKLEKAFLLTEGRLKNERNESIANSITNDVGSIQWEGLLDDQFKLALKQVFPEDIEVKKARPGRPDIDIRMSYKGRVIVAIESKGMVSDSHSLNDIKDSLDVGGIDNKLHIDKGPSENSVEKDIKCIGNKMSKLGEVAPHWEIFVPVIYDLYRTGGSRRELTNGSKPYVTLDRYKELVVNRKVDLAEWFMKCDEEIDPIYCTSEPIKLREANRLWKEQSGWKYPQFKSLEAYVSFYAFGRYVEE